MDCSEGPGKQAFGGYDAALKDKDGIGIFLSAERIPSILFIAAGVHFVCFLEGFVAGVPGVAFDMKMCIVAP